MKRRPEKQNTAVAKRPPAPRGAGKATPRGRRPTPGWKGHPASVMGWRNPRLPSVPASLDLNHAEWFTGATLMGLVASQIEEPDKSWCRDWSFAMGEMMAREARKRRRRR
jgi:hypothetical protein